MKHFSPALRVSLVLLIMCGFLYPVLMSGLASLIFPAQSKGSLVYADGHAVGAKYIGQDFSEPWFIKGRPSAVHYNTYRIMSDGTKVTNDGSPFTGLASGSTNLAPSNPLLPAHTQHNVDRFLQENPTLTKKDVPLDLMTTSASGLDPQISPKGAAVQIPAVAKASGLSESQIKDMIQRHTRHKLLGIFGEPTVNVLAVNIDIAQSMGTHSHNHTADEVSHVPAQ